MSKLYEGIERCKALIIDGNPTSRGILSSQLRDLGVGTITQCTKPQDARSKLDGTFYDFVLCDYHFEDTDYSGSDLLEDLRRQQLLPYATTFVMVTGEATYQTVAEAAESALDSYLVKPYTSQVLAERLLHVRHRKNELKAIFAAVEAGQLEQAATLCLQRYMRGELYANQAARIGSELLLMQGMSTHANALYQKALSGEKKPVWALMGQVRMLAQQGEAGPARKQLDELIEQHPGMAEAHDFRAQMLVDQGNLEAALASAQRALDITPSSVVRCQRHGALAFYVKGGAEAVRSLERAMALGGTSRVFDPQGLLLMSYVRSDQRDNKNLRRCLTDLQNMATQQYDNKRLARMLTHANLLFAQYDKNVKVFNEQLERTYAQFNDDDLDVEGACNLLAVFARLPEAVRQDDKTLKLIDILVWRFGGSKTIHQLMLASTSVCEAQRARVAETVAAAQSQTQNAMAFALQGDHRPSVVAITRLAEQHRNAKWMDMAAAMLERYRDRIDDAEVLAGHIRQLREGIKGDPTRLPLSMESSRPGGTVALRLKAAGEAVPTVSAPMAFNEEG